MREGKRTPPEIIDKIRQLYSQGLKPKQIYKTLGVGRTTVDRYARPGYLLRCQHRRAERRVRTTINGVRGFYKVKKRIRPENCELCDGSFPIGQKILQWHHWDDFHLELGMWLCIKCHIFAGRVEEGKIKEYQLLKEKVYELAGPLGPGKEPELLSMRPFTRGPT